MNIDDIKKLKVIRFKCELSLMFFTRYIFKEVFKRKFKQWNHLIKIADVLERVAKGELKRVIINVPPRYGKTEIAVKMFIAWGLALNPKAKFIHLSYSDNLALDNSSATREYLESESFQKLWHIELKKDARSKKKWYTKQGGGVMAASAGGAVTGFGAGNVEDDEKNIDEFLKDINEFKGFGGAIIVDDPLKPDDAKSSTKREHVNKRYNNTIQSRTNSKNTPIIYIMQRLHEDDPSGYLLNGGSGDDWHHLKLSAIDENGNALCEDKHSLEDLRKLESSDPYMFSGQYLQEPSPLEGGKIKKEWFEILDIKEVPNNLVKDMYIDGAFTKETTNDPSGIMVTGYDKSNDIMYIFNSLDEYLEMPELLDLIPKLADEHDVNRRSNVKIEPKASGQALRPMLVKNTKLNASEIKGKQVSDGKLARVDACSPTFRSGKVKIVKGAWNSKFLNQISIFPNGKHDEHVDNLCYAAIDYFGIYKKSKKTVKY